MNENRARLADEEKKMRPNFDIYAEQEEKHKIINWGLWPQRAIRP